MSEQRKVCLFFNNTQGTACQPAFRLDDENRTLTVEDDTVRWCAFIELPRRAQCDSCAGWTRTTSARQWLSLSEESDYFASPARILAISLMCCGLHGSLDTVLARLVMDIEPSIAFDLLEQRGYSPERLPRTEVDWPSSRPHEHAWLPWRSGDERRASTEMFAAGRTSIRRCTCGLFEHEMERDREWRREIRGEFFTDAREVFRVPRGSGRSSWMRAEIVRRVAAGERVLVVRPDGNTMIDSADALQRYLDGDPVMLDPP